MHAWPSHYVAIAEKMNGFSVVIVGYGMCSCGLFSRGAPEHVFKTYDKKGWSKNKIARAIENQARAMENRRKSDLHANLHPDFRRWLADASADAKEAYLYIHWAWDELALESEFIMSLEEFRAQETYIKDEQLIHIKR